ncbi:oxalate decarboxylase oxdC, putative [Cordyceps militaris CM01]|uniref:Oxalate decarboxylase oxdC, putative n=1 Tax=Cordyceps militaris (strain CM01) TaxID=983644 RepID=G3JS32_CORMM|nr:oxalate decarboxylase oxdC, putative [Cordyceps militaris CM01]EGX88678.1 oxalate decarboxylase oxdC, putative [Cordyceps militaris CM01]
MRAASVLLGLAASVLAAPSVAPRDGSDQFAQGQPISKDGKGGRILGGTNKALDLQNPDNLGRQSTDAGVVPNLKWSFSDSKTRILKGGWVREQVVTDLPSSHDIAGAQQHLKKGAIRELHWHKVAEWGIVYNGRITVSAVDENGVFQVTEIGYGDVWYFPPGVAHTVQGLDDENEFLLIFDETDFDKIGTTFNLDDWVAHTPKDILAKNFGVPESVFKDVPTANPYIFNADIATKNVTGAVTPEATGDASFVYRTLQHAPEKIGGTGGTFYKIDSTNFPISKEIAATFVTLKPGGLRELHWHPNAEEWLYFHKGSARATAFIGGGAARTFDFSAGDTAVFPTNAGHYIENTSKDEDLVWIEIYKSDHVADISLSQWLALTPPEIAAQTLKVPVEFIQQIKREKQVLIE